jgi:hypothetical protein
MGNSTGGQIMSQNILISNRFSDGSTLAMPCLMSVCNKIYSISYFSKRVQFRVSPLRQAEHRVAWLTAIGETRRDSA